MSARGIKGLPESVDAIRILPSSKNLKEMRRFLGMAGFCGRFIERFSFIAEPMHALKRKTVRFLWGQV